MKPIDEYIKNLTKCSNSTCSFKHHCLRYSKDVKEKFSCGNNKCDYYFENKYSSNKETKDIFDSLFGGFKK